MKFTKTFLLSLLLLLVVFLSPISCYSQAGIVGKAAAKKTAKTIAKQSAKKATNSAVKGAIKKETNLLK